MIAYAYITHLVILRFLTHECENEKMWVFTLLKTNACVVEMLKVRNDFGVELTLGIAIPKSLAKRGFTRSLPTSWRMHGMLLVGADG